MEFSMGQMIEETEFNEGQAIIDALLTGGKKQRQEKIQAINRKKRKYKGIYRVQDGNRAYWMLDKWGNPQLQLEEQTVIRLTPDGMRVYMPEWLPQNTVLNRVKNILPEYGWHLEWNANREMTLVRAGQRKAFERKNGITNWWRATKEQKRQFYAEHGERFTNNMLIPYIVVSGNCEYEDWGIWPNRNKVPTLCDNKATSVTRYGEVVCDEHSRNW